MELLPVAGNWKAWSNVNSNLTRQAFNRNLKTGWSTRREQRQGDNFVLDLGSLLRIGKVELLQYNKQFEFPKSIRFEGSREGV